MTKKLTNKELELYEHLAEVNSSVNIMQRIIGRNLNIISKIDNKTKMEQQYTKFYEDMIDEWIKVRETIQKSNIPKRFITLNKL